MKVQGLALHANITGLAPGTIAHFRVRAVSAGGVSQNPSPVAICESLPRIPDPPLPVSAVSALFSRMQPCSQVAIGRSYTTAWDAKPWYHITYVILGPSHHNRSLVTSYSTQVVEWFDTENEPADSDCEKNLINMDLKF